MKKFALAVLMLSGVVCAPAYADQLLEGTRLEYPATFVLNTEATASFVNRLPPEGRALIKRYYEYDAKGVGGISNALFFKSTYAKGFTPGLDSAVDGMAASLRQMDGVSNVRVSSLPVVVSGRQARRLSVSADRYKGEVGIEALVAYDPATNSATHLQFVITAEKGALLTGTFADKRAAADRIIKSISFVD